MKKTTSVLAAIVLATATILSCSKENKSVPLRIMLTDAPASYDAVNVHIKAIRVKMDKDSTGWIDIPSKDTVVNLLDLRNGVTTELAQGNVPEGTLKEVRFILGSNNSIVVNGQEHPLITPSAEHAGLKIKIDKKLGITLNSFTLDFDAALSVKEESNGYKLHPVIKIK